ncbi:hypothetical protein AHAS_Ahas05G0233800 [Arachis hypogaea]
MVRNPWREVNNLEYATTQIGFFEQLQHQIRNLMEPVAAPNAAQAAVHEKKRR